LTDEVSGISGLDIQPHCQDWESDLLDIIWRDKVTTSQVSCRLSSTLP
jgi:hypothetical protein